MANKDAAHGWVNGVESMGGTVIFFCMVIYVEMFPSCDGPMFSCYGINGLNPPVIIIMNPVWRSPLFKNEHFWMDMIEFLKNGVDMNFRADGCHGCPVNNFNIIHMNIII